MGAPRTIATAFVVCLVVSVTWATPFAAAAATPAETKTVDPNPAATAGNAVSQETVDRRAVEAAERTATPETDNTVTRIEVHANGSATWTLSVRTRLETDAAVEEYEAFQAEFRENRSRYLGPFRDRMRGVVENAENATGREMAARNFAVSTRIQEVPRRWGVVTYTFRWDGFAATDGNSVTAGDVFQGGYFLAENDTLTLEGPTEYGVADASPLPDEETDRAVTWVGQASFDDGRPQATFEPAPETTEEPPNGEATTDDGSAGDGGETTDGEDSSSSLPLFLLGAVVAAGVAVAGYRALGGRSDRGGDARTGGETDGDASEEPATATTAPSDDATGAAASSGSGDTATDSGPALLTDEDRVRRLLNRNDGRIRQSAIAAEFDWSDSKTSRVVSGMAEDGTVEKLRIGRENVIDLAENADSGENVDSDGNVDSGE